MISKLRQFISKFRSDILDPLDKNGVIEPLSEKEERAAPIVVKNLTKQFPGMTAVNEVSFSIMIDNRCLRIYNG